VTAPQASQQASFRVERSSFEWLPAVTGGIVRAVDAAFLIIGATIAYWIYIDSVLAVDDVTGSAEPIRQFYIALVAVAVVLQLNIFHMAGLYKFSRLTDTSFQIRRSFGAIVVLFAVVIFFLYIEKMSATYSRGWMLLWFSLTASGIMCTRVVLRPVMEQWIKQGLATTRVAVVGSGEAATRLAHYLLGLRDVSVEFCGIFDDRARSRRDETMPESDIVEMPRTGNIRQLCELARTQKLDQIILATPEISQKRLTELLKRMRSLPVDVRLCRDSLEYFLPQSSYEFCGILPLLRLYDKPISGWGKLVKRIEDQVLALTLLAMMAPVLLTIAALIKLDSRGPVLFKQGRYGFNNRVITVFKFRTMYHDRADFGGEQQITENDPRVTRVGQVLRRWSLDELPQLLNVLLGDMSVVGPRPHPLRCGVDGRLFEEVVEEYAERHRVKPGITGWAQVHGWHGAADTQEKIRERVKHDLHYIDNWSVLLDLKILAMTTYIVLKRTDA